MSRIQLSEPSAGGGAAAVSSGKSPPRGGTDGGAQGGNLGGGATRATDALGGTVNPQAAGGVDQVANTIQQSLPVILIEGVFTGGLINDVESIYDDLIRIASEYFEDFDADAQYWRGVYKPFLADIYIPLINEFEYYTGDGRGPGVAPTADRDLGRRGQMAAAYTKDIDIAWRTKRRITSQYALGEMRMDDMEASLRRFHAVIDQGVTARRMEDIYEDEFNNRAWNRLLVGTNIGLTGSNVASRGYSSATSAYMSAMQDMANYKTALGNQISAAAGNIVQTVFGGRE